MSTILQVRFLLLSCLQVLYLQIPPQILMKPKISNSQKGLKRKRAVGGEIGKRWGNLIAQGTEGLQNPGKEVFSVDGLESMSKSFSDPIMKTASMTENLVGL